MLQNQNISFQSKNQNEKPKRRPERYDDRNGINNCRNLEWLSQLQWAASCFQAPAICKNTRSVASINVNMDVEQTTKSNKYYDRRSPDHHCCVFCILMAVAQQDPSRRQCHDICFIMPKPLVCYSILKGNSLISSVLLTVQVGKLKLKLIIL